MCIAERGSRVRTENPGVLGLASKGTRSRCCHGETRGEAEVGRAWCERRWLGGLAPALPRPLLPGRKALGFVSPSPCAGVWGPGSWAQMYGLGSVPACTLRSGSQRPRPQAPGPSPGPQARIWGSLDHVSWAAAVESAGPAALGRAPEMIINHPACWEGCLRPPWPTEMTVGGPLGSPPFRSQVRPGQASQDCSLEPETQRES